MALAAHAVLGIAVFLLPALFANALYFRHCRRLVANAQSRTHRRDEQIGRLTAQGGTSKTAFATAAVFFGAGAVVVLALVVPPVFERYEAVLAKTQTGQAVDIARQAASRVEAFSAAHQRYPTSLAEAGFGDQPPAHVSDLRVDPVSGAVSASVELSALAPASRKTYWRADSHVRDHGRRAERVDPLTG